MYYEDELGFKISIPKRNNEDVKKHAEACQNILNEFMKLREVYLKNLTLANPPSVVVIKL